MPRKKKIAQELMLAVVLTVSQGCTTHLPGVQAQEITDKADRKASGDLQLSLETLSELTSDNYRAFSISIFNNTDDWAEIVKINCSFPDLETQPAFLLDERLPVYLESLERRNKIDAKQREQALTGFALGGGALASQPNGTREKVAGAALFAGSVTAANIKQYMSSQDYATFTSGLPAKHVLKPFSIPPKLSLSRWVIVSLKEKEPFKSLQLELTDKLGRTRVFTFDDRQYSRKISDERVREKFKKASGAL